MRNQLPLNENDIEQQAAELTYIFDQHRDKRIVVVGPTCSGKSTLLKHIPEALDMDELIFPMLSKAEAAYVNQTPWTEEIGDTMVKWVRKRIAIAPGHPVFGTVVIPCDVIVYLDISDELLHERTQLRGSQFEDAKHMQIQIETEILLAIAQSKTQIKVIEFNVG